MNNDELGIVFLHHNLDPVTINNLESIRKMNPGATIITMSANKPLPGGYSLKNTPDLDYLHGKQLDQSADRLVCSWFQQRKEICKKWWIVEWDTYCTMSVKDYYRPVWDFQFVASSVRLPYREPEWNWFKNLEKISSSYRPYLTGIVPFIFLLSEESLSATCTMLMKEPLLEGNCELRFATAATRCGYSPCGFSPPNDAITWIAWKDIPKQPTIVHPIKHIPDQE